MQSLRDFGPVAQEIHFLLHSAGEDVVAVASAMYVHFVLRWRVDWSHVVKLDELAYSLVRARLVFFGTGTLLRAS